MTTDSSAAKPKKSWLKLVLFAFLCLTLASLVIGWLLFGQFAVLFFWNGELNKALALAKSNSEQGRLRTEQVFNDAIKANVSADILMRMYRSYAMSLYLQDEIARADEQIDKAIKLAEKAPPSNLSVADQLTHSWQDRATERHYHWLTDPTKPDGAKDQEMSVKVAEAAFGPDHEQTIYKIPGLAKIYADIGRKAEADKLIERCVKSVETKESSRQCAWYVYGMLAHIRAVEHRYKEALAAYWKTREVSSDDEQSDRGWDEFISGLRLHKDRENPLLKQTRVLLNKGDYAELDRLSDKFIKEKTTYWDGDNPLDYVCTSLEFGPEVDDVWFNQLKLDLNTWLSKNPNSGVARAALANLHIYRAWSLRDYDEDGSKFRILMGQAKKILAVSPGIEDKCPAAYIPLLRLTYVSHDKDELFRLNAKGTKQWPTFFRIDAWTSRLLDTNSLGVEGEQKDYIDKRAASIGGAQGDKFYARFAWYFYVKDQIYKVFGGRRSMDWERIKRGFKQIFKEYPDEVEARIAFMRLALAGNHEDDVKNMEW